MSGSGIDGVYELYADSRIGDWVCLLLFALLPPERAEDELAAENRVMDRDYSPYGALCAAKPVPNRVSGHLTCY